MLKTTLKIAALSAVSLTLLSACGAASKLEDAANKAQDEIDNATDKAQDELDRLAGGNGNNNAPTTPSSPAAAVADRVVSNRATGTYDNAGTYVADGPRAQTSESFDDDIFNITGAESQDTFALRQVGDNLVMTVNGTDYTFTPGTPSAVRTLQPGETPPPPSYAWDAVGSGALNTSSSFGSEYDDLRDVLDGTHPTVRGTYVNFSTIPDLSNTATRNFNLDYTNGYATVGTETTAPVVASQTATATYTGTGELNANIINHTNNVADGNVGGFARFSLTMTVDFDGDTVSGTGKINAAVDGSGTVTFGSAPIVGNGFAGTFTMDAEYRNVLQITDNPTGNYAGNFFGPAADDIAGVMLLNGVNTVGGVIGQGGFRADRDTQ